MYRKFANTENLQIQLVQRLLLPEPSEYNFPVWCPTTPKHVSMHFIHTGHSHTQPQCKVSKWEN